MYQNFAKIYDKFSWNKFSKNYFISLKPLIVQWEISSHFDLACGTGDFVNEMRKLGIATAGGDISTAMLKQARKNFLNWNLKEQI